jgi:hypothetical protein
LTRLLDDASPAARVFPPTGAIEGYAVGRPGSRATQIGPCIALSQQAGRALLLDALHPQTGNEVYVDVPAPNEKASAVVRDAGLQPLRKLTRMCRGRESCEEVSLLWASSGPEKG